MFGKLKEIMEAKAKAEEMKKRLESIMVTGESPQSEVVVTATGGRRIVSVTINESVLKVREKLEIEQLIVMAVNKALEESDQLMAAEMKAIMPNIPGLT